jgi:hypothetical protein
MHPKRIKAHADDQCANLSRRSSLAMVGNSFADFDVSDFTIIGLGVDHAVFCGCGSDAPIYTSPHYSEPVSLDSPKCERLPDAASTSQHVAKYGAHHGFQ